MKKMLMGVAIGAGAMYLLDPDHGAERRGKLLGFYSENKDTFQDYAQTATQTAVTVSQTAASAASTVAEKAGELAGKGDSTPGKGDSTASKSSNGKGSPTNTDSLLESRNTAPGNTSPGS
ncbi:MAG TPA: YtxH domain-containing protein [Candidatus Dormibacteraeota bacterium]|nr:YtxH domain-containing protein [Candidatus Dormibacteraeota bacterium]